MTSPRSRSGLPRRLRARGSALAVLSALAALVVAGGPAAGATSGATSAAEDEPGVARVSLIEGEASYMRGDADDWTGVSVNAPLVTGDRFYSGTGARAEIQLDPAVYARIASETELSMLELGPDTTQVRVSLGLVTFRVRRDPGERHVEIDTPGAAIVAREAGVYRVSVDRDGETNVQVRDGEAALYVGGERYRLVTGRGAAITGTGSEARPSLYSIEGGDAWDEWEMQRARRVDEAESYRYVSEDIYGAEDLDEYGDWQEHPEYGRVWRPRDVPADWGPYSAGRWVWVDPWGWTWLDYEPWGWAPFHYGRWVYLDSYWAWAPGPIIAAPVYAPALVGWYGGWGGGVSVSVGFGFGSIGWVPLGWGEPCFPWWGGWGGVVIGSPWWGGWGGPRIVNNFFINKNITNININIKDVNFTNLRRRGGFSTVPVKDFLGGRGGRRMPVDGNLRDFKPIGGRVPVTPTRDSLPATEPSRVPVARSAQPPRDAVERSVVSARTPAGGQPSFARKLPVVQRNQGAPLTPATLRQLGSDSGRAPLVRSAGLPGGREAVGGSASGRETLARAPAAESSAGRSLPSRETMSFGGRDGGATAPGSRSVPRPPVLERGGDMPVAPREGGGSRQPYVARRPPFDGAPSASRDAGSSRGATVPRSTWSPDATGSSRSSGSPPSTRSVPRGSGRETLSQPPTRSYGSPSAPGTRSAPTSRGGSSRSYFSQPRTLSRSPSGAPTTRGYRSATPRSPSTRSYAARPPAGAPQARSAPRSAAPPRSYASPRAPTTSQGRSAPSLSSPRTYSAPPSGYARSAPSRSYSAPSMRSYSAPSAMSRGFSSGGSGRSFGGFGGSRGGGGGGGGGRVAMGGR